MKIFRYSFNNQTLVGVEQLGRVIPWGDAFPGEQPISGIDDLCELPAATIKELSAKLDTLDEVQLGNYPMIEDVQILAPLPEPSKIICIGLNYQDHCDEQNKPRPPQPLLFSKFSNTIAGPTDSVEIPQNTKMLDYEGELAVVIGRQARRVSRENAMDYVFGYMALLDVTARDLQQTDGQWVRAKSQDGFAPCGPYVVTADEVGDPHDLSIRTFVNGEPMQDSNTNNMIFRIDELIEYITEALTLMPGDIISTGTPAGVGVHRTPQVLLKNGDRVEVEIEKLGRLSNLFVAKG